MKKLLKIIAAIAGFLIIGTILFFADAFLGNPISKYRAQKVADKYIAENYSSMDYKVGKSQYNFKDNGYFVRITSSESQDLNFYLSISNSGKINYDSYESDVVSGFNIWTRLDHELHEIGKSLFENHLPYEVIHASLSFDKSEFEPGLFTQDMELDIVNPPLAISATVSIMDRDISYKKAAQLLTEVSNLLIEKNYPVSFYNVSIEYKSEDQNDKSPYKSIFIFNIPSELLDSDNLESALKDFDLSQYLNEKK